MSTSGSRLMLAGILIAGGLVLIAWNIAWATPGSGVVTTILTGPVVLDDIDARSDTDDHKVKIRAKGFSDVYIVHNRIPPGGHTGWHSHPGVSFVTVKAGVVTEYTGDDPLTPHDYPAGTGLVEAAGRVHLFANEGTTDLELIAFQLLPFGATRRIDEPAP